MPEEALGFVQGVHEDLRRIHNELERQSGRIDKISDLLQQLQLGRMQNLDMQLSKAESRVEACEKALERLTNWQVWLSRLLIGGVLTGLVALGFKLIGP